jgi:hypothetical protein
MQVNTNPLNGGGSESDSELDKSRERVVIGLLK